jgi:hypothetical protein
LYFFIGIPASLQSEFSLTPAGTKNPGHVTLVYDLRRYNYDGALQEAAQNKLNLPDYSASGLSAQLALSHPDWASAM